jgi:cytochrome c peroxidase
MRSALTTFKPTERLIARYRTSPLKGLWTHQKGGFYHDGRFATLGDVAQHYNQFFGLRLGTPEINDLVEYLKSLSD